MGDADYVDPFGRGDAQIAFEIEVCAQRVDKHTANHVLHFFHGGEGYDGGDFTKSLIQTICHADEHNKLKLWNIFPAEVAGVLLAQQYSAGLDALRAIAKGGRA